MSPACSPDLLPRKLGDWEVLLTRALLRTDTGDADAIRSFEITPETLAEFCGLGQEHAADAEVAFRQALVADPSLFGRLQHGAYSAPGDDTPNCMAVLALSLLVDSLLEGDYSGNGEYRAKLRQWLGVHRSFMDLRGVALMWEELARWLERKVDDGAPFRRLILPAAPPSWTHIGYTRYLSFPAKRDLRFLQKQLERGEATSNDPAGLIRLLDPLIGLSKVSIGLKQAFQDFRRAFRSGEASVDHRFWRFVERAGALAGDSPARPAELRMEYDEDGRRNYRLGALGTSLEEVTTIGDASICGIVTDSPNLGPNIRRGVLLFSSSGMASWNAASHFQPAAGRFHMAVAERHRRAAEKVALFEPSGDWSVTVEPLKSGVISEIIDRLGIQDVSESVHAVSLVDGARVGRAWLGAARFLPSVSGVSGEIEVRSVDPGAFSTLICVDGKLQADAAVDGEFVIGDREGAWSRRVAFTPLAEIHPDLRAAAYDLDEASEWTLRRAAVTETRAYLPGWSPVGYVYQDLSTLR